MTAPLSSILLDTITEEMEHLNPRNHPFFCTLETFPIDHLNPDLLKTLYINYQAMMHVTRVGIYNAADFLSEPKQRTQLNSVISDDDRPKTQSHHDQLRKYFESIGVQNIEDIKFGTINNMLERLESTLLPEVKEFIEIANKAYKKNLGAFVIIETYADVWMRALYDAMRNHFESKTTSAPYFKEIFDNQTEKRHARTALNLAQDYLNQNPGEAFQIISGMDDVASYMYLAWTGLNSYLQRQEH